MKKFKQVRDTIINYNLINWLASAIILYKIERDSQ
tara:strand:- start:1219 stop:1323 length:105 start_codon:yes stop_codon:yes gene_type:complete